MYLTPSVPNLCTLIQYLSVRGCQTWQSAAPPSGSSKLQSCSKLPTVTSYCRNEIPTSRKVPSMHTSPDTLAWPCHSDPTLAISHAMTQTPTMAEYRLYHMNAFQTLRTYTRWKENLLWQNPLSPQTQLLRPSHKSCPRLTNSVCSPTGTTVDSLPWIHSVQPTKNKPCRILPNLQTKSRSNKTIRPRSSWSVKIYTKTKTGSQSHLNPRLKPTPHSLVTSHSQIITPVI